MFYFKMAVKSIAIRRRQYKSLFAVCAVGVCLMLSAIMITDGMLASMNEKARQYYGGDLQLIGGKAKANEESYADNTIKILKECIGDDSVIVSKRYNHHAFKEKLFFEGNSVRQRVIYGVDFKNESQLFKKFTFVEGNYDCQDGENILLISAPLAGKLGCHVGDEVTLYITTDEGYVNTMPFVVKGIFQDSSVFGMYTSYVNYSGLMTALNQNPPLVNRISMYFPDGDPSLAFKMNLQKKLEERLNMYPFGMDKDDFYDEFKVDKEEKFALITLDSNVSNLKMLVQALKLIVALIVLMLVVIISVGISSTYRVIVIKRNIESGTLRALGMKPAGVMRMFVTEAFTLLLAGSITGFAGALIIAKIASCFNLSFISGFDLFLSGGFLLPEINPIKICVFVSVIIVTTLISVLFTLRKLVHVSPVGAITATT